MDTSKVFPVRHNFTMTKRKRETFEIVGQVGKGTYGTCYEVLHNGKKCAMKLMTCDSSDFSWFFRTTLRELVFGDYDSVFVDTHRNVTHVGAFQTLGTCTLGDVFVTEKSLRSLGYQVASQLYVLHTKGILHNDVKPDNIIVISEASQPVRAKLIDFSLSVRMQQSNDPDVVTIWYRAPELMLGLVHGSPSDVWSFGVVLLNTLSGKTVIGMGMSVHEMLDIQTKVVGTQSVKPLETLFGVRESTLNSYVKDPLLLDLLSNMLHPDPGCRFTMLDVVDHEFWRGAISDPCLPSRTYAKMTIPDHFPSEIDIFVRNPRTREKACRDLALKIMRDMCDEFKFPSGIFAQSVRYFDQLPEEANVLAMCIAACLGALATDSESIIDMDDFVEKFPCHPKEIKLSMHQRLYVAHWMLP